MTEKLRWISTGRIIRFVVGLIPSKNETSMNAKHRIGDLTATVLSAVFLVLTTNAGVLPAILPDPPPDEKAISEYSAADVLSISSVNIKQLPAKHPYLKAPKYSKVIARDWPGAKNPQMIDQLVEFILLSPGMDDESSAIRDALENNVSYIMCEIMDVEDEEKASALIRVVESQSDPIKKSLARKFACDMFKVLLDPRLLAPIRGEFTNSATWEDPDKPERNPDDPTSNTVVMESAKQEAVGLIIHALGFVGIEFDEATYITQDHDADCVRIGHWLDTNAALIAGKCQQAKSEKKHRKWSNYCVEWDLRPQ